MKRKVFLSVLLSLVLTFSLTGCGGDAPSDSQQISEKEEEDGLFDNLFEKKEDKEGYRENYFVFEKTVDWEAPEKNEFFFAGADKSFTMIGYKRMGAFCGGVAPAENLEDQWVLIDLNGKEITKAGEYARISRLDSGKDYFEVESVETKKSGVIDKSGRLIVPCEYDDVNITQSEHLTDFVIIATDEDDLITVYTLEGKKIAEKLSEDEYSVDYYPGSNYNSGAIRIYSYENDEYTWYYEKKGELMKGEGDWVFSDVRPQNRTGILYNTVSDDSRFVLLNEDLTDWTEIEDYDEWGRGYFDSIVDGLWLLEGNDGHRLYDEKGNLVFDFGVRVNVATDEKGNRVYIGTDEDKCVIWDKDYKEVCTLENVTYDNCAYEGYLCGSPVEDGRRTDTKNVYDMKGNVVMENVNYLNVSTGTHYNKADEIVEVNALLLDLNDGTSYIKTQEMEALQKVPEGQSWSGFYMGYPTFNTDEELVIYDMKMNEIGRLPEEVWESDTYGLYVESKDDLRRYYNCKGEFLIEEKVY